MAKILSGLCVLLFSALIAGSAYAASIPPINPTQCQIPGACADMNNFVITPGNGVVCNATGATPQTCNGTRGVVITNSLSTAAATNAAFVINNNLVTAASVIGCEVQGYSGTLVTNGYPQILTCVAGAGTITVNITNTHAANALAGTVSIGFNIEQN